MHELFYLQRLIFTHAPLRSRPGRQRSKGAICQGENESQERDSARQGRDDCHGRVREWEGRSSGGVPFANHNTRADGALVGEAETEGCGVGLLALKDLPNYYGKSI